MGPEPSKIGPAADWLRELGGERIYRVVWEPLLRGNLASLAEDVAAVWFWNKIKLRGGSRGGGGSERLAYYRGGFAALADALAGAIRAQGGEIRTGTARRGAERRRRASHGELLSPIGAGCRRGDHDAGAAYRCRSRGAGRAARVGGEPAAHPITSPTFVSSWRLDRSLSDIYWLNVNDPEFPFAGLSSIRILSHPRL